MPFLTFNDLLNNYTWLVEVLKDLPIPLVKENTMKTMTRIYWLHALKISGADREHYCLFLVG
jgi:hypothetical protein